MSDSTAGIRTRFREQVRQEAKGAALRQLEQGGPQAVSVNAVARELGVSGPALYRYFTNREELLAQLVEDAYDDLAAELRSTARGGDPAATIRAMADAYRAWARRQPHRYRLLFTAPVTDFDTHAARLVDAAQRVMNAVLAAFAELEVTGSPARPRTLDRSLGRWAQARGLTGVPAATAWQAVTCWTLVHGFVSLEIEGNFASMGLDADALFRTQLDAVLGRA